VAPSERDTYCVICKGASLTPLANGFCFGEGPRWFEGLLWFSDMLGEAVHTVNLHGDVTKLALAGHAPSGLGFRPDGSLLIASTENRQVLRYDGETVTTLADLSDIVPSNLGDMVVDDAGGAYVGSQAFEGGVIVRVDPDDTSAVVARDLDFPNGMVITPDGSTLIVAESIGRRLTAFTIAADGSLSDRRIFADGLDGPPDGIALDAEGGVWTSMTLAHQFDRVVEGGTVTDRIEIGDRTAIACTLGGPERRTLFMLSSTSAYPQRLVGTKLSRLDATTVDVPGQRMAAADTRHRGGRPCTYTAAASSGRGQKP
jgi:sugar lactone lactonase YvrE